MTENLAPTDAPERRDFIRDIVAADVAAGRVTAPITRFPPEPNGYLHIGHAKSICLNFGIAQEFGGRCNLRFDDTNPEKEEQEYIDTIQRDIRWLGFEWGEHLHFASDYFEQLYEWATHLIAGGQPLALLAVERCGCQLGMLHCFRQALEHLVGRAGDRDPFVVPGTEMTVRHGDETARAFPLPDLSVHDGGLNFRAKLGIFRVLLPLDSL